MYAGFFGLCELPFNNTPDPRFFYPTPDHEEALASLVYAVRERKGFVLLTGEVGAGKTLVARMMLRQLGQQLAFATINHGVHSATDLMQSVCSEFELSTEANMSPAQLVHILQDFLLERFASDVPVALVLDEAQTLPLDAFEQLRMIGNLEADDAKLLQVVIVGQPELQRRFASREFCQLRQRVFRSFHLPAMNREATEGYIRHRLSIAGAAGGEIFDSSAIDAIYNFSQGLPRSINTLCDNAMLSAYSADRRNIDARFVESVIEQMMVIGVEARSGPGLPAAPPATVAIGQGYGDQPVRVLRAELVGIRQQLTRKVEDLAYQLASFQRRSNREPSTSAQAQGVQAYLEPLLRQTKASVEQAANVSHELQQRKLHLNEFSARTKTLINEVSGVLDNLTGAAARTRRAEHNAREIYNRLVAQSNRSQQLADHLREILSHLAARGVTAESLPRILKQACAPAEGNDVHTPAPPNGPDRLQHMLNNTRASLSELRILVKDATGECLVEPAPDPIEAVHKTDGTELFPSTRLAHKVENLLEMIQSA